MTDPRQTLATLAADPKRLDAVAAADLPQLIGLTEELRAALWGALTAARAEAAVPQASKGDAPDAPDRLLDAQQVAERLGVDRRWVYRHSDDWSFTKRLGSNTLRFDEKGLKRWMESR